MKIFGERTVYGYPQLDRKFERGLLAVCGVIVVGCVAFSAGVILANDSSRDYYSNRDWNSKASTNGREVERHEGWRKGYKGMFKTFSTAAGKVVTFQPYNSTGYISEDGICCTDRWQIGVLNYSSGSQQRALIDTTERSFAPLDSAGRLIGPVSYQLEKTTWTVMFDI